MTIKKILCRYFSENDDHKKVTLASFTVVWVVIVSIISANICAYKYTFPDMWNPEAQVTILGVVGVFGMVIDLYVVGHLLYGLYERASKITLFTCERKE